MVLEKFHANVSEILQGRGGAEFQMFSLTSLSGVRRFRLAPAAAIITLARLSGIVVLLPFMLTRLTFIRSSEIVGGARTVVDENLVGVGDLLEFFEGGGSGLRGGVGVFIGVELEGEFPISLFDFGLACGLCHA